MKLLCTLLAAAFLLATARANIVYKDCGSKVGNLTMVTLDPCKDSPCKLMKGQKYTIKATFTMLENSEEAHSAINGIIAGVSVPFPIDQPNACMDSGLTCPLKNGATYSYTTSISVLKSYPDVSLTVQWMLKDKKEGGNMIACLETPVAIVDGFH